MVDVEAGQRAAREEMGSEFPGTIRAIAGQGRQRSVPEAQTPKARSRLQALQNPLEERTGRMPPQRSCDARSALIHCRRRTSLSGHRRSLSRTFIR